MSTVSQLPGPRESVAPEPGLLRLAVFGLRLIGVWIALIADEWLRGLYMLQRWRRGRWFKHARRVQALAAHNPAIGGHHERLHSRSFT